MKTFIRRVPLIEGDVARVPLSKGGFALIDRADLPFVALWHWTTKTSRSCTYVVRETNRNNKTHRPRLHRVLMGLPYGDIHQVDHINSNRLDNRRCNLRIATNQQNSYNMRPKNPASGFKGVDWPRSKGRWRSRIRIGGVRTELGHFATAEDAARAYDEAAKLHHREFALTNADLGLL